MRASRPFSHAFLRGPGPSLGGIYFRPSDACDTRRSVLSTNIRIGVLKVLQCSLEVIVLDESNRVDLPQAQRRVPEVGVLVYGALQGARAVLEVARGLPGGALDPIEEADLKLVLTRAINPPRVAEAILLPRETCSHLTL